MAPELDRRSVVAVVALAAVAGLTFAALSVPAITGTADASDAATATNATDGQIGLGSIDPGENASIYGVNTTEANGTVTVGVELRPDDGVNATNATVHIEAVGPDLRENTTVTRHVNGSTNITHTFNVSADADTVNVEVEG